MKKYRIIPLKNGGHITWTGSNPPTEEKMKIFEKMAAKADKL